MVSQEGQSNRILHFAGLTPKLVALAIAPHARLARLSQSVWPLEIEGTMALLNGKPELASRIKAAIHLDMVGGRPETKTIFHVTRGPASLPSFAYDIAAKIGDFVDAQASQYAMTGTAQWPLVAPEGGRDALRAAFVPLTLGSDHEVYSSSSWSIPAIYLNDWPESLHPHKRRHAVEDRSDKTEARRLHRRRQRPGPRECNRRRRARDREHDRRSRTTPRRRGPRAAP